MPTKNNNNNLAPASPQSPNNSQSISYVDVPASPTGYLPVIPRAPNSGIVIQLTKSRREAATAERERRAAAVRIQRLLSDEARTMKELEFALNQTQQILDARDRQVVTAETREAASKELRERRKQEAALLALQRRQKTLAAVTARERVLLQNRELATSQRTQRRHNEQQAYTNRRIIHDAKQNRKHIIRAHEQRCATSTQRQRQARLRDIHASTDMVVRWQEHARDTHKNETRALEQPEEELKKRVGALAERRREAILRLAALVQEATERANEKNRQLRVDHELMLLQKQQQRDLEEDEQHKRYLSILSDNRGRRSVDLSPLSHRSSRRSSVASEEQLQLQQPGVGSPFGSGVSAGGSPLSINSTSGVFVPQPPSTRSSASNSGRRVSILMHEDNFPKKR
eukprot:PhM_4_TR18183/c0_g2_i1/m.73244